MTLSQLLSLTIVLSFAGGIHAWSFGKGGVSRRDAFALTSGSVFAGYASVANADEPPTVAESAEAVLTGDAKSVRVGTMID